MRCPGRNKPSTTNWLARNGSSTCSSTLAGLPETTTGKRRDEHGKSSKIPTQEEKEVHSVPTRRRTLCQPSFFRWKCYRLPSIPTGRTPMHPLRLPVRAARSPRRPRAPRPARPLPRVRTPPARLRPLQTRRPALLGARRAPRLQPRLLGDIVPRQPLATPGTPFAHLVPLPLDEDQRPSQIPISL